MPAKSLLQPIFQPIFQPLPLLGLSTAGLVLATSLTSSRRPLTTMPQQWPIKKYTPSHTSWPYHASDFTRQDPSSDASFYSEPRFVTHIDDAAIASLRSYYDTVLPKTGKILDFCSSWVSHYPPSIEAAAQKGELQVIGLGMSRPELDANQVLNHGRIVEDLNEDPNILDALVSSKALDPSDDDSKLSASTNVVSTDYLTQPVEVLRSLREATKPGGSVHLTISNRCFPTKAISRWLRIPEEERLEMVGDFLHFAGWRQIEIVELSNGQVAESVNQGAAPQGRLQSLMAFMGMNSRDPLWVVRAVKE